MCKPEQRLILAVWVLLRFIDSVEPMAHYPAVYPSQIFFLKENVGYEIVVLYEGEQGLLRLLQPEEDLKYIIVLSHISMAEKLRLPKAPCLFATVEFQGEEEPEVIFYSEEEMEHGRKERIYHGSREDREKSGATADGSDFARSLSVIRSREIRVMMAVQSLGQLQNRYGNNLWAEIIGNCDIQLMLGCTDDITRNIFQRGAGR